ncbi:hypothetical protein, partial [Vibrio splendidus]|uniref:hypothetical protein n=1 Tax=Vibrio splendidus TaxID=29497 RepID=UPI001C0058DC
MQHHNQHQRKQKGVKEKKKLIEGTKREEGERKEGKKRKELDITPCGEPPTNVGSNTSNRIGGYWKNRAGRGIEKSEVKGTRRRL